ncbi:hypothetical protein ACJMK2_017675 [Sinanodonta woodiana]|uniref:Major facilitator superfamily (MFS) profile domain-containing protein n=1 Tax=Sinanodonta woodiana TaxID=1069815 RepID=A0ABD3UEX3_SINWO
MFLVIGLMKTTGIFFVQYQKSFKSSSSMTSLITSVQNGVYSVASLLVMTLGGTWLSSRRCLIIGGTLSFIAYVINSLAEKIEIVIFAQGVVVGMGFSFIHSPTLVLIGKYFEKRRGLANSIAVSAASLGGLVWAPIVTLMFEHYGYSGTHLIIAAILLNCLVTAGLFRPPEMYTRPLKTNPSSNTTKSSHDVEPASHSSQMDASQNVTIKDISHLSKLGPNSPLKLETTEKRTICMRTISYQPQLSREDKQVSLIFRPRSNTYQENGTPSPSLKRTFIVRERTRTITESNTPIPHYGVAGILDSISKSNVAQLASAEQLCASVLSVDSIKEIKQEEYEQKDSGSKDQVFSSFPKSFVVKILRRVFDFELLRNPIFLMILTRAFLIISGLGLIPVYIAPHARENGLDEDKIAVLYSIMGFVDLLSRVVFGIVADKNFLQRSTLIGISAFIVGVAVNSIPLVKSFASFVILTSIYGTFGGVYFSLFAVNLVDYLGIEKLSSCLGFTILCHGVALAVILTVIGALRDASGSYLSSFHFLGTVLLMASAISFAIPFVDRKMKARKQKDEDQAELEKLT